MNFRRGSTPRRVVALLIVGGILLFRWLSDGKSSPGPSATPSGQSSTVAPSADGGTDNGRIQVAFANRQSGTWVEGNGVVERLLADDTQGDRHQKFILRLAPDHTILVSHNIDLAERLQIELGDTVTFRGKYEWNDRGGVVHWTHHNPRPQNASDNPGGWLKSGATTVQ